MWEHLSTSMPTGDSLIMVIAKWCGYSVKYAPLFEEAMKQYANLYMIDNEAVDIQFPKLDGYPTLYIIQNGQMSKIKGPFEKALQKGLELLGD